MANSAICAYAAGIIDGEGSISVERNKHGTGYAVQVANKSDGILNWLLTNFGGHIYSQGSRDYKRWQLCRKADVLDFLTKIEPYLIFKRQQAQLMIELCRLRLHKNGKLYPFTEQELSLIEQIPQQNWDNGWSKRR